MALDPFTLAEHQKEELLHREARLTRDIVRTYNPLEREIKKRIRVLKTEMDELGLVPTEDHDRKLARLEHLLQESQLTGVKTAHAAAERVTKAQKANIVTGISDAQSLLRATSSIRRQFNIYPADALNHLAGSLANGQPLALRFQREGQDAADALKSILSQGIKSGLKPSDIALNMALRVDTLTLRNAEMIARQESMRVYRESGIEQYKANGHLVKKWRWLASRTKRTCFPAETLIETARGTIPIESVVVGDEVLTHTGHYRRVTELLSRQYDGDFVTITANGQSVVSTKDHPFLAKTAEGIDWCEAQQLTTHDSVFLYSGKEQTAHRISDESMKDCRVESQHIESLRFQKGGFPSVLLLRFGRLMPVGLINFQHQIERWQKKVNGLFPTFYFVFLQKLYRRLLQDQSSILLRPRLSCKRGITFHRTESTLLGFRGNKTERLSACQAFPCHGWTTASFRAMLRLIAVYGKFLPAALANGLNGTLSLRYAGWAISANSGRLTIHLNTASTALHQNALTSSVVASSTTKYSRFSSMGPELLTALLTNSLHTRKRIVIPSPVWVRSLIRGIASFTAKTLFIPLCMGWGKREPRTAGDAGKVNTSGIGSIFHASIISRVESQSKGNVTVFNFEVEDDHSYVANGFVVHNCPICLALDGTLHDISEPFGSHVLCRCTQTPVLDEEEPLERPTGAQWFAKQDAKTQLQILGPTKGALYQSGKLTLAALVDRHDSVWGPTASEKSLATLISEKTITTRDIAQAKA